MKDSKFWASPIEIDEYLDAETLAALRDFGRPALCDLVLCLADEEVMNQGPPDRGINPKIVMHLAKRLKDHFNLETSFFYD